MTFLYQNSVCGCPQILKNPQIFNKIF